RNPPITDQSLFLQPLKSGDYFGKEQRYPHRARVDEGGIILILVIIRANVRMKEKEIDLLSLQRRKTARERLLQPLGHLARMAHAHHAFRCDAQVRRPVAAKGFARRRFRLAPPVKWREVEQGDAALHRLADGRHRLLARCLAPDLAEPATPKRERADGPELSEASCLHVSEILRQGDTLRPASCNHRVAEKTGNRHQADTTRHRRDRARNFRYI